MRRDVDYELKILRLRIFCFVDSLGGGGAGNNSDSLHVIEQLERIH